MDLTDGEDQKPAFRIRDINPRQTHVMIFIKWWAENKKTPVPRRAIIEYMATRGVMGASALHSINALITKGYIRRGYSEKANVSLYVMIRNI